MHYNYKHIVVMNIQVFPHWLKYLFFVIFFISYFIADGDDLVNSFNEGYNSGYDIRGNHSKELKTTDVHYFENLIGGEKNQKYFIIISILGLLGYVMTKERVEDDYIKFLRLSSYQLAFFAIILTSLIIYLVDVKYTFDMVDTMITFLTYYLIIFAIKKRIA